MARLKCQRCAQSFDGRADSKYCGASCRAAAGRERRQKRTQAYAGASRRRSSALTSAFTRAFAGTTKTPVEVALTALARVYGREIDRDPGVLAQLGPQLLAVLTKLGMTPDAGAGEETTGGSPDDSAPRGTLVKLRERADRRKHRASTVDTAAP